MLGKLLKYEIPAMGRMLLPLYGAWAVASIFLGFTLRGVSSKTDFFAVMTIMLYVAVTVAVFVMSIIIVVQRYRKSMLGDEAYFNMALPVSMNEHIANKAISALVWMTASALASLISFLLIILCAGAFTDIIINGWKAFYDNVLSQIGFKWGRVTLVCVELIIGGLMSAVKSILAIYAALTIGHQAKEHTTLASIGAYIGLSMAETMLGDIFFRIAALVDFDRISDFWSTHNFAASQMFILVMYVVSFALIAAYFFICKYLMDKKLNLN